MSKLDKDLLTLHLARDEVEALHFCYTKNGIPETQVGARRLAAKLERALKPDGDDAGKASDP